jgi:hypothetical protein
MVLLRLLLGRLPILGTEIDVEGRADHVAALCLVTALEASPVGWGEPSMSDEPVTIPDDLPADQEMLTMGRGADPCPVPVWASVGLARGFPHLTDWWHRDCSQ